MTAYMWVEESTDERDAGVFSSCEENQMLKMNQKSQPGENIITLQNLQDQNID